MSVPTRALLLGALANVGLLPFLTGHALLQEASDSHGGEPAWAFEHPDVALLLLLTVAAFVPLARLVGVLRRLRRASERLRALAASGSPRTFEGIDYVRIAGDGVTLFAAGFGRPTIYVSAGAESSLTRGQFHAALLHERAHVERQDVRWLALMAALARALAFVPWSRRTFASLHLLVERRADERALLAGASRADLFEAIVAASGPAAAGGAALSEIGTLERLRWLAEARPERAAETRATTLLLALPMTPAAAAHLLLWAGVICAVCSTHVG